MHCWKFADWYWNTFLNVVILYIILMYISCLFLLMTYCLLVILYLFWAMDMLDKKQIWVIFLFEFKMGLKAMETAFCVYSGQELLLVQELLIYIQCSGGSRKFAKATRDLKMGSVVATIESWQRPIQSNHWSWSSYNNTRRCQRTQLWTFYSLSEFEANWKGEKAR